LGEGGHVNVAFTTAVVCYEAVCTCGWEQHHRNEENAKKDAEDHMRNWHAAEIEEVPTG
jgi:predicted small metal-binding protein